MAGLSRALPAGLMLLAAAAGAQTADRNAADAALVERVKEAVIKQLRESDALDRAIHIRKGKLVGHNRAPARGAELDWGVHLTHCMEKRGNR